MKAQALQTMTIGLLLSTSACGPTTAPAPSPDKTVHSGTFVGTIKTAAKAATGDFTTNSVSGTFVQEVAGDPPQAFGVVTFNLPAASDTVQRTLFLSDPFPAQGQVFHAGSNGTWGNYTEKLSNDQGSRQWMLSSGTVTYQRFDDRGATLLLDLIATQGRTATLTIDGTANLSFVATGDASAAPSPGQ